MPTPKGEWPVDAEATLEEREKLMNANDLLALQKKNITEFAATFIVVQPILLQFNGLNMSKKGLKFGIIGANCGLTMINFYAPKIGKEPVLSTFDENQYLEHVYVTLTKGMEKEARDIILEEYEKYKKNPKEAMMCLVKQNGKETMICLADLVNEKVIESLKNSGLPDKNAIVQKRNMFTEASKSSKPMEIEEVKTETKSKSKKKKDESPSKSEGDVAETKTKSKKKKDDEPKKSSHKKKQKTEEEHAKNTISINSADPELANKLTNGILDGFSKVFDYPNTLDNHVIMAKVCMDTAAILKAKD